MVYISVKNFYTENQNILISGISNKQNEKIYWQLSKINEKNKNSTYICVRQRKFEATCQLLKV